MTDFRLDVVVGGVQKAATTSLFGHLRRHPQLATPHRKELHWFDNEAVDWTAPPENELRQAFPEWRPGRLAFDVTPIYLFWPPSLERMSAHNPGMCLIFIFRDPIERAWSHWRMEKRRNAEHLAFDVAIREGRDRLRGIDPVAKEWRVYSYVERGFYARQLQRLFALFPREQVLLLRSADLENDHNAVLRRLATFLKIDPFPDLSPRRDHQTAPDDARLAEGDISYLRHLYREDVCAFSVLSGLSIDDWLTMEKD